MRPFSLLVKPAGADCNLRCAYCFYLPQTSLYPEVRSPRMTEAVLERMIASYLTTPQPQYAFGWQGGEPMLMGLEFFRRVTDLQQRYALPGAAIANGLQTNGTLITDAWAEHLARYRFLVGVSLDGPPEMHDRFRRTIGGQPTHAEVVRGIEILRRHGVEFNILTLVSQANVRRAVELYRYLCDQGFSYQQYIECVEFDRQGRRRPWAIEPEAWGDFLCALYDEWVRTDTRRVSIRLFDALVAVLAGAPVPMCSLGSECREYFVVEHNGDVFPCDFFVRKELRLGNVLTDSWESLVQSPLYGQFAVLKRQVAASCGGCPYHRLCHGDCLKNRGWDVGRDPRRRSALCEGWKRFYRHALPGLERLAAEVRAARGLSAPKAPAFSPPRPRRNDPCPCGSGRKFKKCCGAKAETKPVSPMERSDRPLAGPAVMHRSGEFGSKPSVPFRR